MTWQACVAALAQRATLAPAAARDDLLLAAHPVPIGSIDAALARRMAAAALPLAAADGGRAWHVTGPADAGLAAIAHWLDANGLGGRWRNELLGVADADGMPVAMIERAAVRPLGIATQAVHLVGRTPRGDFWVQQRALDKATDPGLWDTTMGGLMAADETIAETLARETWEEAGLRIGELEHLEAMPDLVIRRPVAEGHMVERIHVFVATVPAGLVPVNQDGEVAGFESIDGQVCRQRVMDDRFTLEAALILARFLPEP